MTLKIAPFAARTESSSLLLLHGGGPGVDARSNWQSVWEPLTDRFTCLAPDLVGFGDRIPTARLPRGPLAWSQARARQLLELINQHGLDRVHLVGNSAAGGAAALALMALAPERIGRAVLMGGAGTGPQPINVPFYDDPTRTSMYETLARLVADQREHTTLLDELTEVRWRQAMAPGAEAAFRSMFGPDQDGKRPVEVASTGSPVLALHGESMFGSDQDGERPVDLSRIGTPVLALHGELDHVSPIAVSERLVRNLPDARLKVVAGAGHWIHVDRPNEFCTEVEEFLSA